MIAAPRQVTRSARAAAEVGDVERNAAGVFHRLGRPKRVDVGKPDQLERGGRGESVEEHASGRMLQCDNQMNIGTSPSMAKQDDSVNRIPGRSIADIMPRGAAGRCHRQRSRFIGWPEARSMKWRRVQAGQAKDSKLRPSSRPPLKPPLVKAPLVRPWLPLEMRLHIHARLRAPENNEIRHRRRMTAHRTFIFDLDQFWNRSTQAARTRMDAIARSRKSEGASEGPFEHHQRR